MTTQNSLAQREAEIRTLLTNSQKLITSLCAGNAKESARFMAMALLVAKSDTLSACTPFSIVQAIISVVGTGLNPDPNVGHIYLIPYWDKNSKATTVQVQISYKGFKQLAWDAGWDVNAKAVYKCDHFEEISDGFDNKISYKKSDISYENDGDPNWVYDNLRLVMVSARHIETQTPKFFTMSKSKIEQHRLLSPNQKDSKRPTGNFWLPFYEEMALKTGVRKMVKLLPYHTRLEVIEKIEEKVVEATPSKSLPSPIVMPQVQPQANQQALGHNTQRNPIDDINDDVPNYSHVDQSTGEIYDQEDNQQSQQAEAQTETKSEPETAKSPESVQKLLRSAKTKKNLDTMIASLTDVEREASQDVIDECLDLFR